jgi:hypothetical protein
MVAVWKSMSRPEGTAMSLPNGSAYGLALAAMLALQSAALAGPAVATRWQYAKMKQEECLKRAEQAISRAGLDRLERTTQSRYGTRDDYTGVVRCVTSSGIVFFVGSGPGRSTADALAGALFEHFGPGQP